MHPALMAWLARNGISLHEGCRLLRQHGVSLGDIYGDAPSDDFNRGAAEVEGMLAEDPNVVLQWSNRPLWVPVAPAKSNQTVLPASQKGFDNVHQALRFVDEMANDPEFHCPMIFSSLGVLWDWSSLGQRPEHV